MKIARNRKEQITIMSDNEKSFLCSIQVQASRFVDKRRASHCAICIVSFIQFFVGRGYSFYSIPPHFSIKQQTESLIKNCCFKIYIFFRLAESTEVAAIVKLVFFIKKNYSTRTKRMFMVLTLFLFIL